MELILSLLAAVVMLILIWTIWHLQKLQQRFSVYGDYNAKVSKDVIDEVISKEFLAQLRNQAQLQLTNTVAAMDNELKSALHESYKQLMEGIEREAAQIINGELEQYRQALNEARVAAANISSESEKQLLGIRDKVKEQAQTAIREEKKQLLDQLDTKLGDVVANYLLEALGESVDLGAQKEYILRQLEAHKEEIKRDINDEF